MAADDRLKMPAGPARRRLAAGALALAFIVLALGAPFLILPLATGIAPDAGAVMRDPYIRGVLQFTLLQAGLSTLFSVVLAVPLALALHRTPFRGRGTVLRMMLLPQALPTLVAALGILAVWGRSGIVSDTLVAVGFGRLDIYGLTGILLAHVFFNMPLATRLILSALSAVPAESWKLAGQLSLGRLAAFRLVEWPAIRPVLPGIASLIFMLCVTSFALVLVLGGGPAATTLEVAIYQSLRYDFDPGRVIALALLQIALVTLVLVPMLAARQSDSAIFSLGALPRRFDVKGRFGAWPDALVVLAGLAFVMAPFVAILDAGLRADLPGLIAQAGVQRAMSTSLAIAVAATALGLCLSLTIALARRAARSRVSLAFDYVGSIVLVVPPIVVGAGWFLILRAAGWTMAPAIVVMVNAIMAVPFMTRILSPALDAAEDRYARLTAHLGLGGVAAWRLVLWPALRGPAGLACAFGLALSLGDLGVVALFGSQDLVTLPYLLLQRMGSYRTTDADGLALILAVTCLVLMWLAESGFRRKGT